MQLGMLGLGRVRLTRDGRDARPPRVFKSRRFLRRPLTCSALLVLRSRSLRGPGPFSPGFSPPAPPGMAALRAD
jgi:hypothetical protein